MIAYGEQGQIYDLKRREFSFGTKDAASVTQSFMQQKIYDGERGIEKASDTDIRRGQTVPLPYPILARDLYTFSIGY